MLLPVPEKIEQVLWEGPLDLAPDDVVARSQDAGAAPPDVAAARDDARNLPVVSIAAPEVWPLTDLYKPRALPAPYRALLNEADFYLVRLGCSFRARRDHVQVQWARFLTTLLPGEDGQQPIAFDLHPLMIESEARRNVKVSLSPALKFSEVEASLGSLDFGLEYSELQPIVSASGVGESNPSWDYETAHGRRIQGSKWMHILVKAPKGMASGHANLSLSADVESRGGLLQALVWWKRDERAERLRIPLWGA